jgi:hypothetical protein
MKSVPPDTASEASRVVTMPLVLCEWMFHLSFGEVLATTENIQNASSAHPRELSSPFNVCLCRVALPHDMWDGR